MIDQGIFWAITNFLGSSQQLEMEKINNFVVFI